MKIFKSFINFLYEYAIIILFVLIVFTAIILFWLRKQEIRMPASKPGYHFFFIAQNSVDPFWSEVLNGVRAAAEEYNVAVEFQAPRFNDADEVLKYIDIATISKVDGIITHVSNGESFTEAINEAVKRDIPVITIENDNNKSKRQVFVGTNSFIVGRDAAKLLIEATGGKANIAIITSMDSSSDFVEQNLKLNGLISTFKEYPDIKIVKSYSSKLGILSAEEITQDIIDSEENINAIFTLSSADTIGVAQFIVDRNRVGDMILVGYGSSEGILKYIDKGVIYGTVASDPFKMGYESLKALVDIKEGKDVPTFVEIEINSISEKNISSY